MITAGGVSAAQTRYKRQLHLVPVCGDRVEPGQARWATITFAIKPRYTSLRCGPTAFRQSREHRMPLGDLAVDPGGLGVEVVDDRAL